jgi:hypothetical protein
MGQLTARSRGVGAITDGRGQADWPEVATHVPVLMQSVVSAPQVMSVDHQSHTQEDKREEGGVEATRVGST